MDVYVGSESPVAIPGPKKSHDKFRVTLEISIEDIDSLWVAASDICTRDSSLSPDEVDETIGPREDPSIADCLTTITLSARLAGCKIVDFSLEEVVRARNADAAISDGHDTAKHARG